jgi:Holliday junction resolvase
MTDRETGLAGGSLQARSENEVRTSISSDNASTITTQAARRRGGARHRRKGDRIERELVERHRALGLHSERYPLSGASRFRGSGHDLDIYAFGQEEAPLIAECKARKDGGGFVQLEKWLGECDALFLRRDHADPLVLIPWRTWAALLEKVRR